MDPLQILNIDTLMSKSTIKKMISTKITVYHENELRAKADRIDKMKYLNVSLLGLNGTPHPVLLNIRTSREVRSLRPVLKLLAGDYYSYEERANRSGGSPHCRLCSAEGENNPQVENVEHIVTKCVGTETVRIKLMPDIISATSSAKSEVDISGIFDNSIVMTQYLLDCTSMNLRNQHRIHINDPACPLIYSLSRNLLNGIHQERIRKLKNLEIQHSQPSTS